MNLRQRNIAKISDVEFATLEPNGQVGFILKKEAQPVTVKQFNELKGDIEEIKQLLLLPQIQNSQPQSRDSQNLFTEVAHNTHLVKVPPKHLQ